VIPFPLFLAYKYLKPKRSFISVVTLFSVVGVLLGVAILVIVLSVMTGFDNMWRTKILSFKPHLTVTSLYGVIEDDEALCEKIAKVDGVKGVAASVEMRVMIQHEGRMSAPVLLGVSPDRAASVSKIPENMMLGSFDLEDENVVIGVDMASQLGVTVGDHIFAHSPLSVMAQDEFRLPEDLVIAGIFDLGMRDFDGGFVLTSIGIAQDMMDMDYGAYSIYVMTEDPFQFKKYMDKVQDAVGDRYVVRSWQEVDRVLFEALAHEKSMMFILLAFITVVAIFCVTVTLIVIVVQKTSEIGLLKALGVPTWKILLAFLIHGWVQCLIGTISGVAAGLAILVNLPHIVSLLAHFGVEVFPKEIYGLSRIPWETSAGDLIRVCVLVMVACTASCAIPVLRAAFLEPVEAFRQE